MRTVSKNLRVTFGLSQAFLALGTWGIGFALAIRYREGMESMLNNAIVAAIVREQIVIPFALAVGICFLKLEARRWIAVATAAVILIGAFIWFAQPDGMPDWKNRTPFVIAIATPIVVLGLFLADRLCAREEPNSVVTASSQSPCLVHPMS